MDIPQAIITSLRAPGMILTEEEKRQLEIFQIQYMNEGEEKEQEKDRFY